MLVSHFISILDASQVQNISSTRKQIVLNAKICHIARMHDQTVRMLKISISSSILSIKKSYIVILKLVGMN